MKIKGCPFCGSNDLENLILNPGDFEGVPVVITCFDCGARGPIAYVTQQELTEDLPETALKSWNHREKENVQND